MPTVKKSTTKRTVRAAKGAAASRKTATHKTTARRTSAVAPGRRANKKGREFGKRGQRPPSRLSVYAERFRSGDMLRWPILAVTGVLVAAALVYGAFLGGHVAAAGAATTQQVHQLIAAVGFRVDEVTVRGRGQTTTNDVLHALQVVHGDSIFAFDTDEARIRLERLDWVTSAQVTRLLPNTVHIELVEQRPFAIWQLKKRLVAVVDRNGRQITDKNIEQYGYLPLIMGHGAPRRSADFIKMVQKFPALAPRVRAYRRVADRRWDLRLENGVTVLLPEINIEAALVELVEADEQYRLLSRDVTAIDLRLPDRLTVRLAPDAAARREASNPLSEKEARRKWESET
ncbi:MAG: FtsQ-type POTRA domain-containing protein [Parvibaculaceae bacterium]|nr:FtsQ-type POTRA domain-containing protein [Parvibaculaceae bacterium]